MSRVLVTGGCGFLGSYLVRDLLRDGHEVTVVDVHESDLLATVVGDALGPDAVPPVHVVDVNDVAAMSRLCKRERIDAIAHLAGLLTGPCAEGPTNGALVNLVGTSAVFQLANQFEIEHLAWASSISVFGHAASTLPLHDSAPHSPDNFYALYHSTNEGQARLFHETFGQPSIGLRVAFGYGYGRARGRGSWVTDLLARPGRGESARVGGGNALVPWSYVDDIVSAFAAALTAPVDGCRIYNMRGEPRTKQEAADFISRLLPDLSVTIVGDAAGYPTGMDESNLRHDLGWKPRHSMEAGILATINRYRLDRQLPPLEMPADGR